MNSFEPFILILLPPIVATIVAILIICRKAAGMRPFPVHTSSKHHLVPRMICSAIGAIVLIAVGVVTWQEVQHCYISDDKGNTIVIHAPAKAIPPLPSVPKEAGPNGKVAINKTRLLCHLVIAELSPPGFRAIHAEEFEVQWPADRDKDFTKTFNLYGSKAAYSFTINSASSCQWKNRKMPTLELKGLKGGFRWERVIGRGSRSKGENSDFWASEHLCGPGTFNDPPNRLLSVAAGPSWNWHVFSFMTQVAEDDPLKEIPLAEFIRIRQDEMHRMAQRDIAMWRPFYQEVERIAGANRAFCPGFSLMVFIGISALFLLGAAIMISQVFSRRDRGLAFAGILTGVVLYVAVLDRMTLSIHLSHLTDPQAPLRDRLMACYQVPHTFFYRNKALREVEIIAKDPSIPEPLHNLARKTAILLKSG